MLKANVTWPGIRQGSSFPGCSDCSGSLGQATPGTLFNGLASPLFFALATVTVFLATQFRIHVTRSSLLLYVLFSAWVIYVDARSGEFLPALAQRFSLADPPGCQPAFRTGIPRLPESLRIHSDRCSALHHQSSGDHVRHGRMVRQLALSADLRTHPPPRLSIGFLSLILFTKTASSTTIAAFFRIVRILGLALVFWSGTSVHPRLAVLYRSFILLDRTWLKTLLIDTTVAIALSQIPPPAFPVNQWTPGTVARTMEELTGNASSATAASSDAAELYGRRHHRRLVTEETYGQGWAATDLRACKPCHGVQISTRPQIHPHNAIVQLICDWGSSGCC